MMHDYHEDLAGFHPDQIFHDGCDECERRGANVEIALTNMDVPTFRRAWLRAQQLHHGGPAANYVSNAEVKVLRVLAEIGRRLDEDPLHCNTCGSNDLARYTEKS